MCLILFAHRSHSRYPLVLAANRDEFFDRPTAPAHFWPEAPEVLAGRDLRLGGTWLGLTRGGRLALLTNYRDPAQPGGGRSRGEAVSSFLRGGESPAEFLRRVREEAAAYKDFNLVVGDRTGLGYFGSRDGAVRTLAPAIYGLSNRLLDTPWPKVARGKQGLERLLRSEEEIDPEALFALLADRHVPADAELPQTGIGPEWERLLAPAFIRAPGYGTRSSTVILIDRTGGALFVERTFGVDPADYSEVRQSFRLLC